MSTAEAFNPDGDVLFLATSTNILVAIDSDGSTSAHGVLYRGGHDLCHIAVSPDGLSVGMKSMPATEAVLTFSTEPPPTFIVKAGPVMEVSWKEVDSSAASFLLSPSAASAHTPPAVSELRWRHVANFSRPRTTYPC